MPAQNRLFSFTRNEDLLIGLEVVKADQARQIIRKLQRGKQMVEDWKLDIFCRDPQIIADILVEAVEPGTALGSERKYCISLLMTPASKCIGSYMLTVAWFRQQEEAEAMLDTVQAYITLRYGV